MKTIAVVNQKGGVAKTTSTQNIAYGLSQLNKKVLVIDFDPQGNLTSGFGIDKRNLEKTIYDLWTHTYFCNCHSFDLFRIYQQSLFNRSR